MKGTKVQTLGAVTLYATTACTDEASIIGWSSLNWAPSVLACCMVCARTRVRML